MSNINTQCQGRSIGFMQQEESNGVEVEEVNRHIRSYWEAQVFTFFCISQPQPQYFPSAIFSACSERRANVIWQKYVPQPNPLWRCLALWLKRMCWNCKKKKKKNWPCRTNAIKKLMVLLIKCTRLNDHIISKQYSTLRNIIHKNKGLLTYNRN